MSAYKAALAKRNLSLAKIRQLLGGWQIVWETRYLDSEWTGHRVARPIGQYCKVQWALWSRNCLNEEDR